MSGPVSLTTSDQLTSGQSSQDPLWTAGSQRTDPHLSVEVNTGHDSLRWSRWCLVYFRVLFVPVWLRLKSFYSFKYLQLKYLKCSWLTWGNLSSNMFMVSDKTLNWKCSHKAEFFCKSKHFYPVKWKLKKSMKVRVVRLIRTEQWTIILKTWNN